jgi:SAM-dependent methyltransferase
MTEAERMIAHTPMNYSATADAYAEFWSPVIRLPGRRLLEALPWDHVRRVLDVGTGTGALIPEILNHAPTARVIGIDPSWGMLARAMGTRVPLVAMDAMALGVRAGTFDVAVLAFVLFHVPDPPVALAEVRRVLRRRGSVGMTTWAEEPATPANQIWDDELGVAGAWDPRPQATQDALMNAPEKVRDLLDAAGFTPGRVWIERVEHQWSVPRFMGLRTGFGITQTKARDPRYSDPRGMPRQDRSTGVPPRLERPLVSRCCDLCHGRGVTLPCLTECPGRRGPSTRWARAAIRSS